MMTRDQAIELALQLLREEIGDTIDVNLCIDQATGIIFRELSRLPESGTGDADQALESLVKLASAAVRMIAELVEDGGKEDEC